MEDKQAEVDILAGMGLSAEEAAAAAEKVQAIQRGKLARRKMAAQAAEAAVEAEEKAAEADSLAGMSLSAEEAAAAAEKVQAIQRG